MSCPQNGHGYERVELASIRFEFWREQGGFIHQLGQHKRFYPKKSGCQICIDISNGFNFDKKPYFCNCSLSSKKVK